MGPVQEKGRARPTPAPAASVDLFGVTHAGMVRRNNEDHFLISRFGRYLETMQTSLPADDVPERSQEQGYAMIVADGVGGEAAGEEASRLAISSLVNLVLHTPDWILRLDDTFLPEEVLRRAAERYELINKALGKEARAVPALAGFATTLTGAWSLGRDLFLAHVGDSRAYLLSRGSLMQLTRDHTLVEAMVRQKQLDRREAATHSLRHVLTQCLGDHKGEVQPDVAWLELHDNDRLLLCTDGLTAMVNNAQIAEILALDEPAETIGRRLLDRALDAGGKDNVTVVVARYRFG